MSGTAGRDGEPTRFGEPARFGEPTRFHPDRLGDHPLVARASSLRTGDFARAALVVAIPATDEEERIEATLRALDAALHPGDGVVLAVNNTRDTTVARARRVLTAGRRPFLITDLAWSGSAGSAPLARRLAMDCAQALAPRAHLVSLDADTLVRPLWRESYADLFTEGFDLVCGGIGFIPEEAARLPPGDEGAEGILREARALSREAEAVIDPDPDNPWPHHGNIGGANFGLRAGVYERVGGIPFVASAEDRELLRRARALRLRVRFAGDPLVWTSCRLDGRARGGLSDELARSRRDADPLVDEALEPAETLALRVAARRDFRHGSQGARAAILYRLGFGDTTAAELLALEPAAGWLAAEDASPALRRRQLRRSELSAILPGLVALRDRLKGGAAGDPGGSPPGDARA